MAWFNFGKKEEKIETTTEVEKETSETSTCLGVFDFFALGKSDQLLILGRLKGNLKLGDRLQVCNPGESFESFGELTVEKLSNGKEDSNSLADEALAHIVVTASEIAGRLKKGSVLYTSKIDERQLLSSYTDALYTSFVEMQNGDMSNEDYLRASLEDSVEILRLFLWDCRENRQNGSEEEYQKNLAKIAHLEEVVRDKLLEADEVYVIYSQLTGEPYMFSKTYDRGDDGYLCTDPLIHLSTSRWYHHYKETFDSQPNTQVRRIENTEDKEAIKNFLGSAFYLNGALGIIMNSDDVCIKAQSLVEKPDFSNLPEIQVPVMNPDVVRWLLLLGQLGKPDTEDKQLVDRLYYGFLSKAVPKAKFLIPVRRGENFPEASDKAKEVMLEKGASLDLPVREGKDGRQAISLFTDWKRLRMVFDEEWDGMIEPAGNMIAMFDYIVNGTEYLKAGCYISQDSFKEMEKLSAELNDAPKQ